MTIRLFMFVLMWLGLVPGAMAAHSSARLVADVAAYQPGRPLHVALELTLDPGWHSYWRNPGDAGAAPSFDLEVPADTVVGAISWPVPVVLHDQGVTSFAYLGQVLLSRALTPASGMHGTLVVTTQAAWLACAQICVPQSATLTLSLPQGAPVPSGQAQQMAAAAASIPGDLPYAAHIAADGTLWFSGMPPGVRQATFLPDDAGSLVIGAPQILRRRAGAAMLALRPGPAFKPDRPLSGVLLADGVGYVVSASPGAAPAGGDAPSGGLLVTLLLSVAGGALLNLMPCVFPVLAMKAVGFAALGGAGRRRVRALAVSYSAGVLVTFVAVGVVLLVLRSVAGGAGWGVQFRYPAFVAAMVWVCFTIGLAFSGALRVPGLGVGQGLAAGGGHVGSFASGLLAVLVASPCTGPFMATAVAAAAVAPPWVALLVFFGLGVGFAAPTLLLAAAPGIAAMFPRPGRWMIWLQQGLAFPMYAAAVWLVWVLGQEAGPDAIFGVGIGCVLIGLAAWAWGLAADAERGGRRVGQGVVLVCMLGVAAILPGIAQGGHPVRRTAADAFSAARLLALRQAGRPVLVNMTAAWCVTCLVNERVALRPALPALTAAGVAYLTGDWTRQDPDITEFLTQYGRDGVPLYVFFAAGSGPGQPGRILPQILTPALVSSLGG